MKRLISVFVALLMLLLPVLALAAPPDALLDEPGFILDDFDNSWTYSLLAMIPNADDDYLYIETAIVSGGFAGLCLTLFPGDLSECPRIQTIKIKAVRPASPSAFCIATATNLYDFDDDLYCAYFGTCLYKIFSALCTAPSVTFRVVTDSAKIYDFVVESPEDDLLTLIHWFEVTRDLDLWDSLNIDRFTPDRYHEATFDSVNK